MKIVLLFLIFISGSLSAQTIMLDNTFGNNGFSCVPGTFQINKTLFTQDGKIVSIGYSHNPSSYIYSATLTKHDLHGIIYPNFGINGVVQVHNNYACQAFSGVLQDDGKIILIGSTYLDEAGYDDGDDHAFISRLKSNGELDSSFATNGSLTLGSFETFNTVFVNQDHSILVSGNTYNGAMLYKLNEDGFPDINFGINGMKELFANGYDFYNYSAIKTADGNILSVGTEGHAQISCQKLNLDGELVTGFGEEGHFIYNVDNVSTDWEYLHQAAERVDGKIVLSGQAGDNFIALINSNGTIDSSFGNNGIVEYNFDNTCILVQEDNKTLVAGSTIVGQNDYDIYFSRFTPNGQLDPMFDSDGHYLLDITGSVDDLRTMEFLNNSHLLLAGTGSNPGDISNYVFLLASVDISQTLSAKELDSRDFSIYPNPVMSTLFLDGISPEKIRIQNNLGQVIMETTYSSEKGLNLQDLATGSYFLSFVNERGSFSKAFVKF